MATIHPTAVIDQDAQIADSAIIGPYCVIGSGVTIGQRTVLHNHVTVQTLTRIGDDNVVYPFVVIGADPQDKKFNGEPVTCEIGDNNRIREHVTIHRGTENGGGVTRVGSNNLIMVASHVAHDCLLADDIVVANQVMLAGHVRVESNANIGGGAGVHHFTTIGRCSFVGGLSRIRKDVPPYMIVEGDPAEVRSVNAIAMKRAGFGSDWIEAVKHAFKLLYRDNGSAMAEKIALLRETYPEVTPVIELCDSLRAAGDGVHGRALEVLRPDDKRQPVRT